MGVDLEWGLNQQHPDLVGGVLGSLQAGRQLGLQRQADNAFATLKSNPNDQQALTTLAATDPQRANAFLMVASANRAAAARQAAGQVIQSSGAFGAPQPQQAPQVPAQPQTAAPGAPGQPQPQQASPASLDASHPAVQQVGAAASAGQVNPTDAWAALYSADPELGDKMMTAVKSMDDMRRSRLAETSSALANAAQSLKSVPVNQRQAAAMKLLPQLQAHGVTPEMVQNADLSDAGLNGLIGQSVGALGMMQEADKQREIGVSQQNADTQSFAAHSTAAYQQGELANNSWKSVQPGEELHQVGAGAGGGSVAPLAGVWASIAPGVAPTSGIRTPAQQQALVQSGATFATNSAHLTGNAIDVPIVKGLTPQAITQAYAQQGIQVRVVQETGNGPGQGTGPHFHIERTGGGGGQVIANSGDNGTLTPEALDQAAKVYNLTGQIPASLGRGGLTQRAIVNRAAQLANGQDVGDLTANRAATKADMAGLQTLEKRATIVRSAENAAVSNGQLALQLGGQNSNGNVPLFNAWRNAGGKATGDPKISAFNAAVETFANEYATVVGKGVPTDSLRSHAHGMINTAQSPAQLQAVIQTLNKDMSNVSAGLDQERQSTMARISGHGAATPGQPKQPPAGATKTATGPNGEKVALVGGKWVGY